MLLSIEPFIDLRHLSPRRRWRAGRVETKTIPLFLAVLALTTGCDGPTKGVKGSGFEVRDSAGITIVMNGSTGSLGPDTLVLEEELRIGVLEGEEPYQFFQVHDLALDESGTLFVGNSMTGTVRAFSPDGTFLREFGGKGEGPGEVFMVNQVWLAGDSVVVTDWQRGGKTVVFTKTGDLIASWRSTRPDNSRITPFGFNSEDWIGFLDPPYTEVQRTAEAGEAVERRRDLRYLFPDRDSVGGVYLALPPRILYGSTDAEGLDWGLFEHQSAFDFDGDGNLFLSRGHPYQIDVFDLNGQRVRSIRREYAPVPITDEDVEAVIQAIPSPIDTMTRIPAEMKADQRERVERRVRTQASFPRPATLGALGRLFVGRDGAFWVERADALSPVELEVRKMWGGFNRSSNEDTIWDIFDNDGRFLGTVRIPPGFAPMAVEERAVVGVVTDSMDVEYVVRFRLVPP